jgi:Fuc2NAc and GlcNAc transferase
VVRDVAVILLAAGFAAGLALGWGALRLALLAYPNDRSSHVRPTPTAGGVAFALPLIAYLVWLGWLGAAPALVLGAGSAALALCGFWDDLRELPASVRLLLHAVVAVAVVWVVLPGSGWLLGAVLVVALVWHINLYNFMDGIDGSGGGSGAGLPARRADHQPVASGLVRGRGLACLRRAGRVSGVQLAAGAPVHG